MAFKLNGKTIPIDVPFTSNGINYPANWLRLTSLSEKEAIGITEVSDEPRYDQRFYWGVGRGKDLARLKADWVLIQKETAASYLSKYDWYITRKVEKGNAVPTTVSNFRDQVRSVCKIREDEINAANDVDALVKIVDSTITSWPIDPNE